MTGDEIAIIGMHCRVPGANGLQDFWNNLAGGKHSITFLTEEELAGKKNVSPAFVPCKGGILQGLEFFDAPLFGYSPREAELMDPQMRVFHESVWSALEDAGYTSRKFSGDIGLYAGASDNLHWRNNILLDAKNLTRDNFALSQLIDKDFICSRVAYNLNLTGPCISVQTACSTSLVAVHLACQGILNGECDMAIAGGVSVHYGMEDGYIYKDGAVLSPDGSCRAFDNAAAGTVPGSGVGLVVLKLLKDAIEDKDAIYAVIKGSAINNDGNSKTGYSSPGISGQVKVIKEALNMAEVDAATISYVETHGTGTPLGDPVEIEALKLAYGGQQEHTCGIGSVKSNVGHLDVAAGVTGLIKTVLSLQHKKIPASINFSSLNKRINLAGFPFYVVSEPTEWKAADTPLRAAVSSFGIGGTNAHVVLEEYQQPVLPRQEEGYHLVPLSAKSDTSLQAAAEQLNDHLLLNSNNDVRDIAFTLTVGRHTFNKRKAFVAHTIAELQQQLSAYTAAGNVEKGKKDVLFMFSGQGSQYVNMGINIYRHVPLFRHHFGKCLRLYKQLTGRDMEQLLYPENGPADEEDDIFRHTVNVQPLLYMFEYALAGTLTDIGLKPVNMIGHSIGEYVAACLAGVFSFEDGLKIVVRRAELMQVLPMGAMLSINAGELVIQQILPEGLSIAAVNTQQSCVVSGESFLVEKFAVRLQEMEIQAIPLKTSHAFHSEMMRAMCEPFLSYLEQFTFKPLNAPFISNVSGNIFTKGTVIPAGYWIEHILGTVAFSKGLETLLKTHRDAVFIEVGPGHALSSFVKKVAAADSMPVTINPVKHIRQKERDDQHFLSALAALWESGMDISLDKLYHDNTGQRLHLPGYVFDKHTFNIATPLRSLGDILQQTAVAPASGISHYVPVWEQYAFTGRKITGNGDSWLVFADQREPDALLVQQMKKYGVKVITVNKEESFNEYKGGYGINKSVKDDYYQLFRTLKEKDQLPVKIVYAWAGEEGFYDLVYLIQAIGALGISKKMQLEVLAGNSLNVLDNDCKYPGKALMQGLIKIIPLEYENISCRFIDVDARELGDAAQNVYKLVLGIMSSPVADNILAIRGGRVWRRQYRKVDLAEGNDESLIKENGIYLITGGAGGMALAIARQLCIACDSLVVLVGRSPLAALEEQDSEDARRKLDMIADMSQSGCRFIYMQADVCDQEAMENIVRDIEDKYGKINGVLHTAAVIDNYGAIQKRSVSDFEHSMRAKVEGTLTLQRVFSKRAADFVVLFSSAGTIAYGSKYGESGYVAANEFLDAMTTQSFGKDTVVKSINWCDWAEVGLSVRSIEHFFGKQHETKKDLIAAFEREALSTVEGVDTFMRIMTCSAPQVAISKTELISSPGGAGGWMQKQALFLRKTEKKTVLTIPAGNGYVAPVDELQEKIAGIWQDYFGYTRISIHDNIFELGANSLDIAQINAVFKSALQIDIPLVTLFEYPSIQRLALYILSVQDAPETVQPDKTERAKNNMNKMRAMAKK